MGVACFSTWLGGHLEELEASIVSRFEEEMQAMRDHNEYLNHFYTDNGVATMATPSQSWSAPGPGGDSRQHRAWKRAQGSSATAQHSVHSGVGAAQGQQSSQQPALGSASSELGKAAAPKLSRQITSNRSRDSNGSINDLWPDWKHTRAVARKSNRKRGPTVVQDSTAEYLEARKRSQVTITKMRPGAASLQMKRSSYAQIEDIVKIFFIVSSPTSMRRLCWDCMGLLMIWIDLFVLPLQVFDVQNLPAVKCLEWISIVYWTLDIPASFSVGYYRMGEVEMRFQKVAKHYLRTWLGFDTMLVASDWTAFLLRQMQLVSMSGSEAGYMRLGKFARYLRMMRLLRLLKVRGKLGEVMSHIQSETFRIAMGIVGHIGMIVTANHIIACGFWFLGNALTYTASEGLPIEEESWVHFFELTERSVMYQYTTSLHWSLTQFTPASMEITPKNAVERIYTVVALLIAMIVFSSFVSSLTASTNRLRNLNRERDQAEMMLRRYLKDNKISTLLSSLICGWVEAHTNQNVRVRAQDLPSVLFLPKRLRTALQEEVYRPNMIVHPFFFQLEEVYPLALPKIYRCMEERVLKIGFELFAGGDQASHMHFITQGVLQYQRIMPTHVGSSVDFNWLDMQYTRHSTMGSIQEFLLPQEVYNGSWLSEHTLWMRWTHQGTAVAATDCVLHSIAGAKFQEAMQKDLHRAWQVPRFAEMFFRYVVNQPNYEWSDLSMPFDILQERAQLAFSSENMSMKVDHNVSIDSFASGLSQEEGSVTLGTDSARQRAFQRASGGGRKSKGREGQDRQNQNRLSQNGSMSSRNSFGSLLGKFKASPLLCCVDSKGARDREASLRGSEDDPSSEEEDDDPSEVDIGSSDEEGRVVIPLSRMSDPPRGSAMVVHDTGPSEYTLDDDVNGDSRREESATGGSSQGHKPAWPTLILEDGEEEGSGTSSRSSCRDRK